MRNYHVQTVRELGRVPFGSKLGRQAILFLRAIEKTRARARESMIDIAENYSILTCIIKKKRARYYPFQSSLSLELHVKILFFPAVVTANLR